MTRRRSFLLSFFAIILALSGACREGAEPRVLLISIDGFRWDYRDRFDTPTLDALAQAGVSAAKMQPGFPSKTFPNHFTLVTGLVPDHHGIVSNTMRDPEIPGVTFSMSNRDAVRDPAWWPAEPIWVTLEKLGKKTAPQLWPGSEAPIGGIRPFRWVEYKQGLSDDERIRLVTDLFDGPKEEWPVFATMYWHAVDDAGHRHGPDSPETKTAVEQVDAALGRLLRAVDALDVDGLHVIVVSDHGMSALSPDRVVYLEDYLDLETIETIDSSPNIGIFPKTSSVDEIYARLKGRHPAMNVYRPSEFPARLQFGTHPRVPPIFVSMDDGWSIVRNRRANVPYGTGGAHGYDNGLDSMQALFVAAGPALKQGVEVPALRSVDVYPLMCRILGIEPQPNDGNPAATQPFMR